MVDPQSRPFLVHETSLVGGGSGSKDRYLRPSCTSQFHDIEPLLLPDLDGLYESTVQPFNPGEFADHRAPAVRLLAINNLGLDVEDLETQIKVWRPAGRPRR